MSFAPPPLPEIIRKVVKTPEQRKADIEAMPAEDMVVPEDDDRLENMKSPEQIREERKYKFDLDLEDEKIVVVLHTKDLSQEDLDLLKKHGSIRNYNYSMFNLDLTKLTCKYLLVDVRDKLNKLHIQRVNKDKFKWVGFVHSFQKHDNIFNDFIENINVISNFPHDYKVAFKEEFDQILTEVKKIKTTGCLISLLSFLMNGASSLLKK